MKMEISSKKSSIKMVLISRDVSLIRQRMTSGHYMKKDFAMSALTIGAVTSYYFIIETNGNTARLGIKKPITPTQIKIMSEGYSKKLKDQITIIHTCLRAHFRTEQSNYYVTAISKEVAKIDSVSERVEILQKMAKQLKKIVLRYKKDGFSENERKICGSICKMFY